MLIDWFTVIAQIINFLILMGLLKYFLYDRVISAMDERQRRVDERLSDSEEKQKQADEEQKKLVEERREFNERKDEMLDKSRQEADRWRQDKIAESRNEIEKLRDQWRRDLEREKKSFVRQLKELIGRETYAVAADFLADLGDRELEVRLVDRFVGMVGDLSPDELESFGAGIEKNGGRITVVSGFELDQKEQKSIERVCSKVLGTKPEMEFAVDSGVILGLELRVVGYRISLTLDRYLKTLEDQLQPLFEEGREPDGNSDRKEPVLEEESAEGGEGG